MSSGLNDLPGSPRIASIGLDQILSALERIEFLSHLPIGHKDRELRRLVDQSFLRVFTHDQPVFTQGEHGHSMFVLLQGLVSVRVSEGGESRHLGDLASTPQSTVWFGEGAIFGHTPRTTTVTSVGNSVVLELEKGRLEKLDLIAGGVLERLEKASDLRTIQRLIAAHRAFAALEVADRAELAAAAKLGASAAGETIYGEAEAAKTVILVRSGVAKLVTASSERILAYFAEGDVAGLSDTSQRSGSLVAMGLVEWMAIERPAFDAVKARADEKVDVRAGIGGPQGAAKLRWSDQLDKSRNASGKKAALAVLEQFVTGGVQVPQQLLVIDLDLCVRCGSCVAACEARHGHDKLTRRGKRLDPPALVLPATCKHCESPECLVGCPTGAIYRKPSGEAAVHDFCSGCGVCAVRCPWDNLTLAATPDRWVLDRVTGKQTAAPQIATRCDLCAGYDESNCVHNCPTEAILRVDHWRFPAVSRAIGEPEKPSPPAPQRDRARTLMPAIAGGLSAFMIAARLSARSYSPWSGQGIALGISALVLLLAAAALGVRRRLMRFPNRPPHPNELAISAKRAGRAQLGPYHRWTRAHLWIGGVAFVAAALHSGLHRGGLLTSLLLSFLVLETLLGLFGMYFYKWMPKVVSRLEKGVQVIEDVEAERAALLAREEALTAGQPEGVIRAATYARTAAGGPLARLREGYDAARAEGAVVEVLAPHVAGLERAQASAVQAIGRGAVRLAELEAIVWLDRARAAFVGAHVALTGVLLLLVLAHAGTAAYFLLRVGGAP